MAQHQRDSAKEASWRGALQRFISSGLSVREFCRREQLTESSFYAWRRSIGERDTKRSTGPAFVPAIVSVRSTGGWGQVYSRRPQRSWQLLLHLGRERRLDTVDFLSAYDDEDVTYNYDNAGQVTGADRNGLVAVLYELYDYDDNGNRESVTRQGSTDAWTVDPNNQLAIDGTNSFTYDAEGNMTGDGVSTFCWDHRNRLIEVRTGSLA